MCAMLCGEPGAWQGRGRTGGGGEGMRGWLVRGRRTRAGSRTEGGAPVAKDWRGPMAFIIKLSSSESGTQSIEKTHITGPRLANVGSAVVSWRPPRFQMAHGMRVGASRMAAPPTAVPHRPLKSVSVILQTNQGLKPKQAVMRGGYGGRARCPGLSCAHQPPESPPTNPPISRADMQVADWMSESPRLPNMTAVPDERYPRFRVSLLETEHDGHNCMRQRELRSVLQFVRL